MNLFKDKRGAELSMNVIIITILVVIVLVVVAFFFTGGYAKLNDVIKNIFSSSVPDDEQLAKQQCQANCDIAQNYDTDDLKSTSNYCKKTWKLDSDGDGKADSIGDELIRYHCWEDPLLQICPGVYNLCLEA